MRLTLETYNGSIKTDKTIWKGIQNPTIRIMVCQFQYKAMHKTQKAGDFWKNILSLKDHRKCPNYQTTETMNHILVHCNKYITQLTWHLAEDLWPHEFPHPPSLKST